MLQDMFKFRGSHVSASFSTCLLTSIMNTLRLTKDTLVNWLLLPQVKLVSDLEDNVEVTTAKVREQRQREEETKRQEEEAKVEWWRQQGVSGKSSVCCGGANST